MSQSVGRALDLIEAVAASSRPMGLMELAEACQLDKSTASRLLKFLSERAFLERASEDRRYALGPLLQVIATQGLYQFNLRTVARAYLEKLRDITGETATLHIPVRDQRICIDGVTSIHSISCVVSLGELLPLTSGVGGKVLIAFPASESARRMSPQVAKAVGVTRRLGYLAAVGDRVAGVGVVAAPIVVGGIARASIVVGGPSDRWDLRAMHQFGTTIRSAAHDISARL